MATVLPLRINTNINGIPSISRQSVSVNAAGDTITAEDFVSLAFKGVDRNEDGSINLHGFLHLAD